MSPKLPKIKRQMCPDPNPNRFSHSFKRHKTGFRGQFRRSVSPDVSLPLSMSRCILTWIVSRKFYRGATPDTALPDLAGSGNLFQCQKIQMDTAVQTVPAESLRQCVSHQRRRRRRSSHCLDTSSTYKIRIMLAFHHLWNKLTIRWSTTVEPRYVPMIDKNYW